MSLISVIILHWNSEKHLPVCLSKLDRQTIQQFEIILVDNASKSDTLLAGLAGILPHLNLRNHSLKNNLGFAISNNIGARLARRRWLALLNADAYPEPDWHENCRKCRKRSES